MLSEYLKTKRIEAGLSQSDVSKALGYTTPQFISNWERGVSTPPVDQIRKLASLLKMSSQDLFTEVVNEAVRDTVSKLERKFKKQKG